MSDDPPSVRLQLQGLDRIAEFCRVGLHRIGTDAIAVAVTESIGGLELVHSTGNLAERIGQLEIALGEGPTLDSVATGLPTTADDLAGVVSAHRWPLFATDAVSAGARSVDAFPIAFPRRPIGALALYSARPGRLTSDESRQAAALADLIGIVLVDPSTTANIGSALRMSVHQAAGMVMAQAHTSIHDALVLLRSAAFTEDTPITEVAADVIAGRRRFGRFEDD
jgi:hypothetical protein